MIRLSLYTRIALGFILLIALVLALQAVVFLWLIDRREDPNSLELTSRLAAELSGAIQSDPSLDLNERVSRLHPREAVFVIMKSGTVSSARRPPPDSIIQTVNQQFAAPIGDATQEAWARSQYRGMPVLRDGVVVGVLGIVPLTPIERFGPELAMIGAVLLVAGALVASLFIVGPVRSRIQELRRAAGRLGGGDFTARAREAGTDEVAELARAFNLMADELERRAAALAASDRARRQLVADVSHELMTPLTAILGHLETLTMAEVRLDDEKRLHQIAVATREAKRLEHLIGDLLDMARLEAGGGELALETIETGDLFEQVAAHHEPDCRDRNVAFVSVVGPGAEQLTVDPFRLEQAIENVTTNALRHTPPGGTIRLCAERSGASVVLTVSDSGEGIAPEHLPHIFDRFYKSASASGMASRGSGLGLSIVKAVVERHGGRVSATSTLGSGTTVRIELPGAASRAAPMSRGPLPGTAAEARAGSVGTALLALLALSATGASAQERVTFNEHVAPILYEHCVGCHRPGGQGPFSLMTYDEVRPRATLVAHATASRYMPPWKPDAPPGTFVGERRLGDAEAALFERWATTGALEGEPSTAPTPPVWTSGWQLGTPDAVITLPEYTLRPEGLDVFRNFVVPIPVTAVRYVRGLEFQPGAGAVHHANIRVDYTTVGERLDEADPDPGYEGLIPRTAEYPQGHFLGWTPGQVAPLSPPEMAWGLEPGARFVVQLHMRPTGKPEPIRPAIALYFTSTTSGGGEQTAAGAPRSPVMLRLGRQNIDIPAGESRYRSVDEYTLPVDVQVHALQPHSHYRARDVRASATLPDGATRSLIVIPEWDFGWQDVYRLAAPLWLPAGTRIRTEYVFDNSAANRRNPEHPPKRARWGFRSSDEMGDVWIQVMTRTEADRLRLVRDFRPKDAAEEAVGYEMQIAAAPDDAALRDDAALLYLELGRPELALQHFESSARLQPGSAAAVYNVGTAHEAAGRLGEASARYEQALKLDPSYAAPRVNLGTIRLMQGRAADALALFAEAARLQPDNADARNNLGRLLSAEGKYNEAIRHLRAAIGAQPAHAGAHFNLATTLLQAGNDPHAAIEQFREALRLRPDWATAQTALAWVLSSHPDRSIRKPQEAIDLAQQAVEITHRDPSALDALAAALAAAGRFDEAVTAAAEAATSARRAGATQQLAAIEHRIGLYRTRQPYVEQLR